MAEVVRDLGNGLVLRWSTAADVERLADCVGRAFAHDGEPGAGVQAMVRRYTRGDYPFMGPDDFALVEDTARPGAPIVSCACYLREEWDYAGIPIPVGRPEIVGTDPDYRRRGLVRQVFDLLHERAATDGTLLQGITGIQYFYRQFGYEYALDLGGNVQLPVALLPEPPADEPERYALRPATGADVPRIADCYRRQHDGQLLHHRLPEAYWHYHIAAEAAAEQGDGLRAHHRVRVVESRDGRFRGFVLLPDAWSGDTFHVSYTAFAPGTEVPDVAPSLLRGLVAAASSVPSRSAGPPRKLSLTAGPDHPLVRGMLPGDWGPQVHPPYAWYLRIPDIPAYLRRIAPVLEARLAASPFAGRTRELAVTLYRHGLRLRFDGGRLAEVGGYDPAAEGSAARAGFPPLVIVQLLVGYRSFAELDSSYPDVWADGQVAPVLDTLFPKLPSRVLET